MLAMHPSILDSVGTPTLFTGKGEKFGPTVSLSTCVERFSLITTWDMPFSLDPLVYELRTVTGSRMNCNVTTIEGLPSSTGLYSS